jgi:formate hydrogenlyase subunit 2
MPCAAVCPVNAIHRVDGAVQLNESLCVSCKLCGIACPFGAIEFSGSRPLDIPANANTPGAPAPPAPARVSSLLDWVPGVRAIAVKCDLCHFDEQGPACVRPARPKRCCWWISAISPRPASVKPADL